MFKLTGILKKEITKDFTRKDGTSGKIREIFIETQDGIYPIKVNVPEDMKICKEGETITLDVQVFPYYFQDKRRRKAFADFYVPNKK